MFFRSFFVFHFTSINASEFVKTGFPQKTLLKSWQLKPQSKSQDPFEPFHVLVKSQNSKNLQPSLLKASGLETRLCKRYLMI